MQQLQIVGERADVPVFAPAPGNGVGDPVDVASRSIDYARQKMYDVVIVDTAGRLGVDAELMRQAADIRDAVDPDETLFVVDAMIGQDAVTTAQAFLDGVGFDGVVLTKLDGDARGGAALSVAQITGRQVMFASNGEKLDDFDVFHPDRMASRILDMGDVLTLIEQAEKAFDRDQATEMAQKLSTGTDFTLEDFLSQMQQVRKMGSLSKLLGMLPGMGEIRDQIDSIDDRDLDRVQAIIQSMTPLERHDEDPQRVAAATHRQRLRHHGDRGQPARGAFLRRPHDDEAAVGGMGLAGMPGMPGLPGGRRKASGGGKGSSRRSRRPRNGRAGARGPGRSPLPSRPAPVSVRMQPRQRRQCRPCRQVSAAQGVPRPAAPESR